MADLQQILQIQEYGSAAVRESILNLAEARAGSIRVWATKCGFDRRKHLLLSVTAPHAFVERSEDYREELFVMPIADQAEYNGRHIDPELMRVLRERYPSMSLRAAPVLMTRIVSERGDTAPRNQ